MVIKLSKNKIIISVGLIGILIFAVTQAVEVTPPPGKETSLPDYIKYLFNLSIAIGGIVAVGALIYSGILFIASGGDPQRIINAKAQALAAFLGLLLLFLSYNLLTAYNPQLLILDIPQLKWLELPAPPPYQPPAEPPPAAAAGCDEIAVEPTLERLRKAEENAFREAEGLYLVAKDVEAKAKDIKKDSDSCKCENLTSICSVDRSDKTSIIEQSGDQCPSYCPPEGDPCPSGLKSKKIPELLKIIDSGRKTNVISLEEAIVEMNEARIEVQQKLEEVKNCRVDRTKRLLSCSESKAEGKVKECDELNFYCCV